MMILHLSDERRSSLLRESNIAETQVGIGK